MKANSTLFGASPVRLFNMLMKMPYSILRFSTPTNSIPGCSKHNVMYH